MREANYGHNDLQQFSIPPLPTTAAAAAAAAVCDRGDGRFICRQMRYRTIVLMSTRCIATTQLEADAAPVNASVGSNVRRDQNLETEIKYLV